MLQSYYLLKLLPFVALLFCIYPGSAGVRSERERFPVRSIPAQSRDITEKAMKRNKLRLIYNSQIGVKERSNANDGPQVEQYLRYTGLPKGNPWCAAFVCWALGKAGVNNPRSAWSPDLFPEAKVIWRRNRRLEVSAEKNKRTHVPRPGDVFGIYFPEKQRIAHCGFVEEWHPTWVVTVEGNTNLSGSREGDGVYRKRRLRSTLYKVADWVG